MGFDIYDMYGYVDRLGSATASCLLFLELFPKCGGAELKKFAENGIADKTPSLIKELAALPQPRDAATRDMLNHFAGLVVRCRGFILLSDGTDIDMRYVCDGKRCVGELCWPGEVPALNRYLKKHGGPLLTELAKKGRVKKSAALMKEFAAIPVSEDENVQENLERLMLLAIQCRKSVAITNGFDDDVVGMQVLCVP